MKFNGKILLFGEYSVLHKSDALLIPLPKFYGEFDYFKDSKDTTQSMLESNRIIKDLLYHFEKQQANSDLLKSFNIEQLKNEIDNGLYFKSTIPAGYGVGSSGALTAAIYYQFFEKKDENLQATNRISLKETLAYLESYFHGKSSGLDPLVSLLNKGIFVQGDDFRTEEVNGSMLQPFLIDTRKSRLTADYVNIFNDKSNDPVFLKMIETEYIFANNHCISSLRRGNVSNFFSSLKELSALQFTHFQEMILPEFMSIWRMGLESDEFYLKLCGAGGGGFILGFAQDMKRLRSAVKNYRLELIAI